MTVLKGLSNAPLGPDLGREFPDERFTMLEHSGDVDCCLCGHKVNILRAFRFEHSAGPTCYMHAACLQQVGNEQAAKIAYHESVKSALVNLGSLPRQ